MRRYFCIKDHTTRDGVIIKKYEELFVGGKVNNSICNVDKKYLGRWDSYFWMGNLLWVDDKYGEEDSIKNSLFTVCCYSNETKYSDHKVEQILRELQNIYGDPLTGKIKYSY